jgi:prevent-host-death family protein
MSTEIGVRDLRNDVSEVLRRAESGEEFVVTIRGRQVARLAAIEDRPRTMPGEVFIAAMAKVGTDPELLDDLRELVVGSIDEIDPWSGS